MTKKKKVFIIILIIIVIISIVCIVFGNKYYGYIFRANVKVSQSPAYIYIPNGTDYEGVLIILEESGYIVDIESFKFVAERKNYSTKVLAGRYEIHDGMSNNELVNLLRSGKQAPVKLTFISVRSLDILAEKISIFIEADSLQLSHLLNDPSVAEKYGFNDQTFMSMFIPNTYEFYWNTSAGKFIERMYEEYSKFWNDERKEKAEIIGLSPLEVSVMASIVEAETQKNDEKPRVAGVYMNRMNKGMLLQADPTVVFAWGDFSIQRVLTRHLQIDSPYNTYLYPGLPPGPINIPSVSSIDAVLNYEKHNYLFFCAKDDFSGYHVFAVTNAQHQVNAQKYHQALRVAGIR